MVVIEMRTKCAGGHGEQLVRVLDEQLVPVIPPVFLEGLETIHLVDCSTADRAASKDHPRREPTGRSTGRLVPARGEDGFDVELYPAVIVGGSRFPVGRSDVYLGACLAHALLPLLVEARERRRHGTAGREACAVWGERLAQEAMVRAYGGRFLFEALEPVLLKVATCRGATRAALIHMLAALLERFVQPRFAMVLMMADLVYRSVLVHASAIGEGPSPLARPLPHEALGVLLPGAALLLAVHAVLDLIPALRTQFREALRIGWLFGLAWPVAVLASRLFLPPSLRPVLAGQPLLVLAYAYIVLTYLAWILRAATHWPFGHGPRVRGDVR